MKFTTLGYTLLFLYSEIYIVHVINCERSKSVNFLLHMFCMQYKHLFFHQVVHGDYIAGVLQVLDVSCGVATFSTYLLPLELQKFSFAPKRWAWETDSIYNRERNWWSDLCFSHKQLVSYHTPVELEMVHFSIYMSIGMRTLPGLLNIFIFIAFLELEMEI